MMERATRNRESYMFLLSSTDVCNYGNGKYSIKVHIHSFYGILVLVLTCFFSGSGHTNKLERKFHRI